jgi:hypothetical protein
MTKRNLARRRALLPGQNPAPGRSPAPGWTPAAGRNPAPRWGVDHGGDESRRARYLWLACRLAVGIGSGLLFGVSLTRSVPGLAVVALLAIAAWPVAVRAIIADLQHHLAAQQRPNGW